jgi:hypothetical protein
MAGPGFRSLFLAGALGLLAATQSCSCGNKCSGVSCATAEACDPTDGICKCGGQEGATGGAGQNGVVCGPTETCNATLQACVSNACASTPACTNGQACDPADGVCKCGGTPCAADQLCDPNSQTCQGTSACTGVICPAGTSCDSTDGVCKCGGASCTTGQACIDGGCAADPCFGVNCTGTSEGNACYGGLCRCGGPDGPVCDTGQTCLSSSKTCTVSGACDSTTCSGGEICGPVDGLCHCGAIAGPVCGGGAVCVLLPASALDAGVVADAGVSPSADGGSHDAGPTPSPDGGSGGLVGVCLGGNLCANTSCPPGESCDPSTGACLCGADGGAGIAGFSCQPNQYCGVAPGSTAASCLTPCNPYDQPPFTGTPDCPRTSGGLPDASVAQCCDYLSLSGVDVTLCQPQGKGLDGDPCAEPTDCSSGFGCFSPPAGADGGGPSCWAYCDTFLAGGTHGCLVSGRVCLQSAELHLSDGGVLGIGACEPSGQ